MSSILAKDGLSVVLGAQWGDEGKGKLSDILCGEADVCARCQVNTYPYTHTHGPHDDANGAPLGWQ